MYQIYVKETATKQIVILVLNDKGQSIPSIFYAKSDSQVEDIVNEYRYDKYKFVKHSLLDDPSEIPDYVNNPEYVEYTNYYFGNYQN